MQQAPLSLVPPATPEIGEHERGGFELGWDHAHHGLVPPPELLLDGTPIGQGWRAGRAVFSGRTLAAGRHVRAWLKLRIEAWRGNVPFENQSVTANHLAQIETARCPVTRQSLGGSAAQPGAALVVRLNDEAAYAAGNLLMLSRQAAEAVRGVDLAQAQRLARQAEQEGQAVRGLEAPAWWRWASLRALATPLPLFEVARLPLAALPPNRTRVLNTLQALQVLLTLRFTCPDWARQMAAVAALLPEHTLRTDFNLFVGALAPRVLEAAAQQRDLSLALEDAWLSERVQRRWLHLALNLGAAAAEALVRRIAAWPLPGRSTLLLGAEQAVEGWALAVDRSAAPQPPETPRPAPASARSAPLPARQRRAHSPGLPRPRATAAHPSAAR